MSALFRRLSILLCLTVLPVSAANEQTSPAKGSVEFFQTTEQSLMDAIALGDKTVWDRIMDPGCVVTTEEGEVLAKADFLKALNPLPPGLSGTIKVADLTVQEFPDFAVVRFLLKEEEHVFGQLLKTQYRVTDTFRRSAEAWQMIASHSSVVTLDPPAQEVSQEDWPKLVGSYRILPDGWTFYVALHDGHLYGGRDIKKLKPLIPLAPNAFTLQGTLGDWIFVTGKDGATEKIVQFRKFEPLVWTRVRD